MLRLFTFALFGAAVCITTASAGPDRVALPDYRSNDFVRYMIVDRPDRKRARFMYVNRPGFDAATPGAPAPEGTVIVMEDHNVALDDAGEPRRDDDGRFMPLAANGSIFVMEKRDGWGAAYPADKRNGDWDYAWYLANGTPRPDANFDGCFACHLSRADRDYTFTFTKYVLDTK